MRYRATLAYDGSAYQGFQRQIGETPTIQLAVERAITAVSGQAVTVIGAGRTDTGVHALGQVIAFDVEWTRSDELLLRAINAQLPEDIALQDIRQQPGFQPRFDAQSRFYRYQVVQSQQRQPLLRNQAWRVWGEIDPGLMRTAAGMLVGEHDFGAFGLPPKGENTVRTVYVSEWADQAVRNAVIWSYTIEGTAFLHHMVRRVVWILVKVGQKAVTLESFENTFRRAKLVPGIKLAPPQGLTLELVRYNE